VDLKGVKILWFLFVCVCKTIGRIS
jgi:hypothetical protein